MTPPTKITAIIQQLSGRKQTPDPDESLFESGFLDSFMLPDMITEIEQQFGIKVPDSDLTPRTFETIERIEAYIERHGS